MAIFILRHNRTDRVQVFQQLQLDGPGMRVFLAFLKHGIPLCDFGKKVKVKRALGADLFTIGSNYHLQKLKLSRKLEGEYGVWYSASQFPFYSTV